MSNRGDSSFLPQNSSSDGSNTNSPPWNYTTGQDERLAVLPSWQVVVFGILAACTSLLTIVGNLIVILSFILERSIRQTSNYFIASLAVSDLLIGCFSMPLYTVYMLSGQHWTLGEVPCDLWLSLDYTVCLCSIYTVFCITVDRFCSVTVPAKYHRWRTERKVVAIVGVTWTVPVMVFFTSIIGWQHFVHQRTVPEGKCYVQYMDSALFNCLLQVGYFWVTLVVMCGLYAGIYRVALRLHRKSENRRKKMTSLVSMAGQTITNIGIGVTGKEQQQQHHRHHHRRRQQQQQQQQQLLQLNGQEATASTVGLRPDGIMRSSSEEYEDAIISRSDFRNIIQSGASQDERQTAKYQKYLQWTESNKDMPTNATSSLRDIVFTNHVNKPEQLTDDNLKDSAARAVDYCNSLHVFSNQSTAGDDRWNVCERSSAFGPDDDQADDTDNTRRQPNSRGVQNPFQVTPEETFGRQVDGGISNCETRFPPSEGPLETSEEGGEALDRSVLLFRFPGDFVTSAKSSDELPSSEEREDRRRKRGFQAAGVGQFPRSASISGVEGGRNGLSNSIGRRAVVGSDRSYPLRCRPLRAAAKHSHSAGKNPLLLRSSLPADLLRSDVEKSDKKSWKSNEKPATIAAGCRKEPTLETREKLVESKGKGNGDRGGDNNSGRSHLFFANAQTSCESDCPPEEQAQLLAPPPPPPSSSTLGASGGEAASSAGSGVVPGGGGDNDDDRRRRRRSRFLASRKWSSRRRAERRLLAAASVARRDGDEDGDCAGDETGDEPPLQHSASAAAAGQHHQMKRKNENRAKKSLRTITLILGAFVICWTPWHVLSLIIGFCPPDSDCVPRILYDISYWLCYINSPLNPFCYAFANQQFKKTFVRILRFDWHKT